MFLMNLYVEYMKAAVGVLDCHYCSLDQKFYVVNIVNFLMNLHGEYVKVATGVLDSPLQL